MRASPLLSREQQVLLQFAFRWYEAVVNLPLKNKEAEKFLSLFTRPVSGPNYPRSVGTTWR